MELRFVFLLVRWSHESRFVSLSIEMASRSPGLFSYQSRWSHGAQVCLVTIEMVSWSPGLLSYLLRWSHEPRLNMSSLTQLRVALHSYLHFSSCGIIILYHHVQFCSWFLYLFGIEKNEYRLRKS